MVQKEDVVQVATSLGQTLTEVEIAEVISRYLYEQEEDPGGTWDLVVEKIMYDLIDERE